MEPPAVTPCRALVGGLGVPGMRDLDFGRAVIRYLEQLDWPEGVVIEDLSCAPHLVLHRIQELHPATVVLIGAADRVGHDAGSVHHYRPDPDPPAPELVHDGLAAAASGMADLDHTLPWSATGGRSRRTRRSSRSSQSTRPLVPGSAKSWGIASKRCAPWSKAPSVPRSIRSPSRA